MARKNYHDEEDGPNLIQLVIDIAFCVPNTMLAEEPDGSWPTEVNAAVSALTRSRDSEYLIDAIASVGKGYSDFDGKKTAKYVQKLEDKGLAFFQFGINMGTPFLHLEFSGDEIAIDIDDVLDYMLEKLGAQRAAEAPSNDGVPTVRIEW